MILADLNVHNAVSVKAEVGRIQETPLGDSYCVTHLYIETIHGEQIRVTIFGDGVDSSNEDEAQRQVYPFVEIERPKIEG